MGIDGCGNPANTFGFLGLWSLWKLKEPVFQRLSVRNLYWKIWQNLQENLCAGVSFLIRWKARNLQLNLKLTQAQAYFLVTFGKFFWTGLEHLWTTTSVCHRAVATKVKNLAIKKICQCKKRNLNRTLTWPF